jgi:hypothetical protein
VACSVFSSVGSNAKVEVGACLVEVAPKANAMGCSSLSSFMLSNACFSDPGLSLKGGSNVGDLSRRTRTEGERDGDICCKPPVCILLHAADSLWFRERKGMLASKRYKGGGIERLSSKESHRLQRHPKLCVECYRSHRIGNGGVNGRCERGDGGDEVMIVFWDLIRGI